jgi:hypothetical protein
MSVVSVSVPVPVSVCVCILHTPFAPSLLLLSLPFLHFLFSHPAPSLALVFYFTRLSLPLHPSLRLLSLPLLSVLHLLSGMHFSFHSLPPTPPRPSSSSFSLRFHHILPYRNLFSSPIPVFLYLIFRDPKKKCAVRCPLFTPSRFLLIFLQT